MGHALLPPEQILEIACAFLDQQDSYGIWCIRCWGISFTTDEDKLEAEHGEQNLSAIKAAIYTLADTPEPPQ